MNISNIGQSIKSFVDPNQIGYLIFYVTNRCNFRCEFCFYYAEIEKGRKIDELDLGEIEKLSKTIGPLLQLSLTGGEPFLRKDLTKVTQLFIDNCAVRYLTIPTNGSLTSRMVSFLEEILPGNPDTFLRLTFSIDGIGDDHDTARSMPGSYQKIITSYEAISPLRHRFPNLVLDANSVFTARSENTLLDTMRHLHEAFEFDNLSVTFARGDIKDPSLKTEAEAYYKKVNDYLESIRRTKENRWLYPLFRGVRDVSRQNLIKTVFHDQYVTPCVAGRKLAVISETGNVYPCELLDRKMGNVRDSNFDLPAIMANAESAATRSWIRDTKCKCSFECALAANVVWNASMYPKLAASALRNIGRE
jgi:radical SAM protein with 4Fe4S-binding SPASM domain